MPVDAKKMLEKIKVVDRGPVNLYLDKSLYQSFKKACGDISASKVLEEFMREFIESAETPKKR